MSNSDFLRLAANARRKQRGEPELEPLEFYGFVMPKVQDFIPLSLRLRGYSALCINKQRRAAVSSPGVVAEYTHPFASADKHRQKKC